ncbi:MAG: flagellar export chaperone FlgN [Candidatus Coatesbacteria bacterium]|nr:flagellar export chaperone FlgN [Candidatus Coatesbacteria bacterium]
MLPSIYPLFDELADAVEAQTLVLNHLAELFAAERELVIRGDAKSLWMLTRQKRELQGKLTEAAQNTEKAMTAVCEASGIDREHFTMNQLPGVLIRDDSERACVLSRRIEELRLAANEAGESGLRTQELLRNSAQYVGHMVKMITRVETPPQTYAGNGRLVSGAQGSSASITL